MAVRLLKVSSVATAVIASSGFYLYSKNVDFNDLSIVRFGRAAATTAVISYDYLTTLRDVQYGTEEYWAVKSKESVDWKVWVPLSMSRSDVEIFS
ncbi:aarF domain-containing protein kinase 1-like [Rhinichthys klamathensis goyatoka]|uniref:aarF domain-containing protein kinase 1-like n=1 Tax=Rhinichthys klamathensis goyatoka TaxID=3034132 RepID=UPI0024B4F337|nr:aarF domain-containing protein kinase 1-like [Rhinichthys klamathensis goyatoka]